MAGNIKTNTVQLGDSATATQNFVWQTNVDGTCKLARGNVGATTQDILTVDANGLVTFTQGKQLTATSSVATTSGTSVTLSSSIPSWVRRITIVLSGVSTNGTSPYQIQIGAGSTTSSGYVSTSSVVGAGTGTSTSTSGFVFNFPTASNETNYGHVVLTHAGSNKWVQSGVAMRTVAAVGTYHSAGEVTLAGTLDRVILTTVGGTDTFDLGSANLIYEG